jgi:hypothetical protein
VVSFAISVLVFEMSAETRSLEAIARNRMGIEASMMTCLPRHRGEYHNDNE